MRASPHRERGLPWQDRGARGESEIDCWGWSANVSVNASAIATRTSHPSLNWNGYGCGGETVCEPRPP